MLPFPFIVKISSPCGGFPLFFFVHVLAKLERPYYLIILGENCNFLGKPKYDVESSTLQLKSEIFPALTPAAVHYCSVWMCYSSTSGFIFGFVFFFHCLNVSIFMVSHNVHCLGSGLFAQT